MHSQTKHTDMYDQNSVQNDKLVHIQSIMFVIKLFIINSFCAKKKKNSAKLKFSVYNYTGGIISHGCP